MANLYYYTERGRDTYSNKRFARHICRCDSLCESAVDFYDPSLQEVMFTLCHNRATDYAYGLLKLVGAIHIVPPLLSADRMKIDRRKLNTSWTKREEKELIRLAESGIKNGDYVLFGLKHGKSRIAVRNKVSRLRKTGRIKGGQNELTQD